MAFFGEPSPLERRQAVTDVANAQRHERNHFRRAYRDASRLARRSKNPDHSMKALSILEQGRSRGFKVAGHSSHEDNMAFARGTLSNFLASRQAPHKQALAAPSASNESATNGSGGFTATQETSDATNQGPVAEAPTVAETSTLERGRGTINGRPTEEVVGGQKESGIYTEEGKQVKTGSGKFIGENEIELPSGKVVDKNSKEAKEERLFKTLEDNNFGEHLQNGQRLQEGLDLLTKVRAGEADLSSLSEEEREKMDHAREFDTFQKDKKEFGKDEALRRARQRAKSQKDIEEEQSRVDTVRSLQDRGIDPTQDTTGAFNPRFLATARHLTRF